VTDFTSLIRDIPDFPEPGVIFKDITPLLADAKAFSELIDALGAPFLESGVSKVAGIEAREPRPRQAGARPRVQ
jgi:adenine phosphoribosyltransferase